MKLKYTIYYLTARKPSYDGASRTRALKREIRENGLICQYCGKSLTRNLKGGKSTHDVATIDHVYSNLDIRRFLANKEVILSCYKCNTNKGKVDFDNVFHNGIYDGDEKHYPNVLIDLLKENNNSSLHLTQTAAYL